jgi:hypothetical protein
MATIRYLGASINVKEELNVLNHSLDNDSSNCNVSTIGLIFPDVNSFNNYIKRHRPTIIHIASIELLMESYPFVEWIIVNKTPSEELVAKHSHTKIAVVTGAIGLPRLLHMGIDIKKAIKLAAFHTHLENIGCSLVPPVITYHNLEGVQVPPSEDSDANKIDKSTKTNTPTDAKPETHVIKTSSYEWHPNHNAKEVSIINPHNRAVVISSGYYDSEAFRSTFYTIQYANKNHPWYVRVDGNIIHGGIANATGMLIIL